MTRQQSYRQFGATLVFAAVSLAAANSLSASGRANLTTSKGLTLSVDVQWLDNGGYRPVKIKVSASKPAAADRGFHVEFRAGTPYNNRTVTASQEFELPAGSSDAEITLRVHQYFAWNYYDLDIWEDGRYLRPLSQQRINVGTGQDWHEGLPCLLVAADKPTAPPPSLAVPPGMATMSGLTLAAHPGTTVLASLLPPSSSQFGAAPAGGAAAAAPILDSSLVVPLDQLPQSWLDYSGIDIVCLTMKQARQMAAEEPARWNALRAWVISGGNLLVSGVPSDAPQLAELERLLAEPKAAVAEQDLDARGWKPPLPESFKQPVPPPFGANSYTLGPGAAAMPAGGLAPGGAMPGTPVQPPQAQAQPQPPPAPVHDPPFVSRRHGLGLVVAVAADDLFAQSANQWQGLLNTIASDRWLWYRRHGVSLQRENRDFWDWPVPGVGLAPVTAFQVLITGFVIAIGPLNYWWLRRRGKLHLLVMVVPLSALLVTLALFGYALAVDGLGVRVRARSVTRIDQRTGEAACWARIAYYAGLAPADGLAFSDDVAIMPLLPQSGDERHGELRRRAVSWAPGAQSLVSGWLVSRTPTQLLTVRSRQTEAGLRFKPGAGGSPPRFENRLGVRIERLLLADDAGTHYRAEAIPNNGIANLEPADLNSEGAAFRQYYDRRRPAVPPGFGAGRTRFVGGPRFRWTSPWNNSLPPAMLNTSLLERELEAATKDFSRPQNGQPVGLQPRSYVAIVERSPEAEYGVDSYLEEESLHVVAGSW